MIFPQTNASVILFICFTLFASGATLLPNDEVEALKQIGDALGKTDWNFSVDPCSGEGGWINDTDNNLVNCSIVNNTHHIDSIILKKQNLQGILPKELIRLPHLRQLDLTRNYLNGTIPPEWGSMNLVKISLLGNRLTGPIPKELGNISTLSELVLEFNQLSGKIPPELGNLSSIRRLHLTSNNFTGELPSTLANLATLGDFRIGDNHFTGNIPNFIQNWTNLEKLVIQASGLDGPIPPGIANLTYLTDLRISDLNGTEQAFPRLNNASNLKTLILRSCNINGSLLDYLGSMKKFQTLDLSFNKLSGEIPRSFGALAYVNQIYLTGNSLSGLVPEWMLNCKNNIDISYNNFSSGSLTCTQRPLNLFGSFSDGIMSGIEACTKSCSANQFRSYFHINCGGEDVNDGNIKFEADTDTRGPSTLFLKTGSNWAYSSTGHFLDDHGSDNLTPKSTSKLFMKNSDLYMSARLAPISLTYYGFCLENGNYKVKLHFAEIMFTDDNTYSSLGRRIFDIYIQGKLELKDFNIEEKAGGVRKEIIMNFSALVTNNTLEIRFYWAGRGTTGIPDRGVYGPLISAISVFDPDKQQSEHEKSTSVRTVVGIVVAVAFVIILLLGILWCRGCLRSKKDTMERDLKGLDLQTGSFTLRQIKAATRNFDAANKIGEGGFGSVYKGLLSDGTIIAVKQLSSKSKQGNREFVNEIGMISALQHPHLVKLYGCCIEGNQLLLVYEYMENNSLARALFGPEECQLKLDWPTRHKICIGIARGLAYLHEESRLKIVHRDIKATNVLLDKNLNPKISDFGLAKLDEEDDTHISTRIAGTYGYMAPEYAMWGYLTDKADVYSFGIVALEIVSGKSATSYRTKEIRFNLLEWTLALKEKGNLMDLVDPKLGPDFNREEVMVMIDIALLCTNTTAALRPAMSSVVSALEGKTDVQELLLFIPSDSVDEIELKKMNTIAPLLADASSDWPYPPSSSSASDLYPINLNSDFLQKKD